MWSSSTPTPPFTSTIDLIGSLVREGRIEKYAENVVSVRGHKRQEEEKDTNKECFSLHVLIVSPSHEHNFQGSPPLSSTRTAVHTVFQSLLNTNKSDVKHECGHHPSSTKWFHNTSDTPSPSHPLN